MAINCVSPSAAIHFFVDSEKRQILFCKSAICHLESITPFNFLSFQFFLCFSGTLTVISSSMGAYRLSVSLSNYKIIVLYTFLLSVPRQSQTHKNMHNFKIITIFVRSTNSQHFSAQLVARPDRLACSRCASSDANSLYSQSRPL